jgi:glycosyltransferase involved in cell wall biosynthesis
VSLETTQVTAKEQFVLAAGRLWDEAKNLKSLTAIASALPWPLRVAGPRQGPEGICAASLNDVCWLGQLSHRDLLTEMSRAAIFVAPAFYEPFGLTILEAATCGCALVLADLPSFRELWGDAAIFIDPHDPAAIRTALHNLCRDRRLRARLQAAASARAKLYSLSAMTMAYRQLYGEMITARSTASDSNVSVREMRA